MAEVYDSFNGFGDRQHQLLRGQPPKIQCYVIRLNLRPVHGQLPGDTCTGQSDSSVNHKTIADHATCYGDIIAHQGIGKFRGDGSIIKEHPTVQMRACQPHCSPALESMPSEHGAFDSEAASKEGPPLGINQPSLVHGQFTRDVGIDERKASLNKASVQFELTVNLRPFCFKAGQAAVIHED